VDGDLFPDAAFVANNTADVVLNLGTTPTKLTFGASVVGADVGRAPGADKSSLIVARLLSSKYVWSAIDIVTEQAAPFAQVLPIGPAVVGCYSGNTYAPAVFIKSASRPIVRMYAASTAVNIALPAGTLSVACGTPERGVSSVFGLVRNPKTGAFSVVAKNGTLTLFSSPSLDSRFTEIRLGTVPRAAGQTPAAAVIARLGTKQGLRVLDRSRHWKGVALPRIPIGSSFTALSGVRAGSTSYIVLQVMNQSKVTTYVKVVVPPGLL
jgi:hypothetical protein